MYIFINISFDNIQLQFLTIMVPHCVLLFQKPGEGAVSTPSEFQGDKVSHLSASPFPFTLGYEYT